MKTIGRETETGNQYDLIGMTAPELAELLAAVSQRHESRGNALTQKVLDALCRIEPATVR